MRDLVTGASRGIGRATATRLLSDGHAVALHGHRHVEELRAWAQDHLAVVLGADLEAPQDPRSH